MKRPLAIGAAIGAAIALLAVAAAYYLGGARG
jgi:hypothetical protein